MCILVNVLVAQLCTFVDSLNYTLKLVGFIVCKLHLCEVDCFTARGMGLPPCPRLGHVIHGDFSCPNVDILSMGLARPRLLGAGGRGEPRADGNTAVKDTSSPGSGAVTIASLKDLQQ